MSPGRHGFSLIEIVAALAIGSLILLGAASLLGWSGELYQRGTGGISAEREARAALSIISENLANAVWHPSTVFERTGEGWALDRIGFLSLQPSDAQSPGGRAADVCAIHYYIDDRLIGGRIVRCLMRGFRESAEVLRILETDEIASLFEPREQDEPLAFGIVAFGAEPQQRDPVTRRREKWMPEGGLPVDAVALSLVVARPELTRLLTTGEDWSTSTHLGDPSKPEENRRLETFRLVQRFGPDLP